MASTLQVKIGKATLKVPLCVDEQTTLAIVQRISDRLQDIEEHAPRIDTQAFALQAAYEFASEIHLLRKEQDQDAHDLIKALDAISSRLQELAAEFNVPAVPPKKTD
jgi:hypothetical protein